MHVGPEGSIRQLFLDRVGDRFDFRRQRSAVGVAQDKALGASLVGRLQCLDGVPGVVLVPVEEVFSVVKDDIGVGL